MLRVITILFLLSALGLQTFYRVVIVADYYVNTATFAQNCENKDRPQLKCHGKCQMMKKLQAEEKKDQQNPERKTNNSPEVLFSASSLASLSLPPLGGQSIEYQHFIAAETATRSFPIFHPPVTV